MTSHTPTPPYPNTPTPPHPQTPLRIAIWCAVSSKPQAAPDKTSLQEQEAAGRKFAAALHGHVVHVYTIPGHSRDLIFWHDAEASIPAYRQLRQDCADHTFDVLFAIDPDRLGRDPALSNQVISLIEKSGAEIYLASAPHPVGQATVGHRYIYAIQTVRAQEDQRRRVRQHEAGTKARVRRGLAASHWPLGYLPVRDAATGKTIAAAPDPDLAPAVLLATKHFLAGDSYSEIVCILNSSPYRPPRGAERWAYSTVYKLLNRDDYAGYLHYDDVTTPAPSPHFPALWDRDTHTLILQERARRARHPYQKTDGSPLAGVTFCGRCGHAMTRSLAHGKTWWLRCAKHAKKSVTGQPCHANYIKEDHVITAISDYLHHLSHDPTELDQVLSPPPATTDLQQQIAAIEPRLTNLSRRRERLALALAAGQMDIQIYRTTDDKLLQETHALHQEKTRLHSLLSAIPNPDQHREAVTFLVTAFPLLIANGPSSQVRAALQSAGLRIECAAGAITSIRFTFQLP